MTSRATGQTFEETVRAISSISDFYCVGLKAVERRHLHLFQPADTRKLTGSVNLDAAKKESDIYGARWDYVIGYHKKVYYVEVHPANTSNVEEMIAKYEWLANWLQGEGKFLYEYHIPEIFYWIPSGKVAITKNSSYFKKLAQRNIKLSGVPLKLTE